MYSDKKEAKLIIEAGKVAGAKAREENFALDLPVVIVEITKSGGRKIIKKIMNGRKAEQG